MSLNEPVEKIESAALITISTIGPGSADSAEPNILSPESAIDCETQWTFAPATRPRCTAPSNLAEYTGRYHACVMSLSRVQISLTGRFTCLEICAACAQASPTARRPKPPPHSVTWTVTSSMSMPSALATNACATVGLCDGAQISQRSPVTLAVAFCGSSVACARYGAS